MSSQDDVAPRPMRRFDEFEAYRGIAAVLVVVFHGYQYTREPYLHSQSVAHTVLHNLDTLVDLFFVLSAFLLTLPWVRASVGEARPQSSRGYVVRRAIRILPVYWVAILVVWASRNGRLPGDWRDLVEHLTFTQVFDDKRIFYTIGPAWSLAVEVMFYAFLLVAGLAMVRLCRRLPRGAALAAWALLGVALVGLSLWWKAAHIAAGTPYDHWSVWFGPAAKADVFAVGMLLAVAAAALPRTAQLPSVATTLIRVAGLAVVGWAWAWRGGFGQPHDEYAHTVAAVGFALVLGASVVAKQGSAWERILATGPMLLLGAISYSVYLWHEPVLLMLANQHWVVSQASSRFIPGTLLLLALSLLVGRVSYLVIEYPVMQVRRSLDRGGRLVSPYVDAPRDARHVGARAPD